MTVGRLHGTFEYGVIREHAKYTQTIQLHLEPIEGILYKIHQSDGYFASFFRYPNTSFGCLYQCRDKHDLSKHVQICIDPKVKRANPTSVSIEYGPMYNKLDTLISRGILSKAPTYKNFVTYDCECLMTPLDTRTERTEHLFGHNLVSLAANAFINNIHRTSSWIVRDDTEEERTRIVNDFVRFILEQSAMVEHDAELISTIQDYEVLIDQDQENGKSPQLSQKQDDLRFLKTYLNLPLIGFNSSRYDLVILMKKVMTALEELGECENLSLLKKGAGYFHVHTGSLVWKDLLNFTPPTSLDNFLKTWEIGFEKLCFPYELYSSITELQNAKEFPDISCFKSSLGKDVEPDLYVKCKALYEERSVLPDDHERKWNNMADYLLHYNEGDVYPMSLAIIKMMNLLEQCFNVNPLIHYGLPSFGFHSMMKSFAKDCPSVVSFPKEFNHLSTLFRKSIVGGIVNPICRHVTTNQDEEAAPAAKMNGLSEPFKKIVFWDLNSMYPAGYCKDQPVGLGFEWTANANVGFTKKLIKNSTASLEAIQWLDSQRNEAYLVDKNGDRQVIRTSWYGSEVDLGTPDRPIKVDGYAKVDGVEYVYEYDGCAWHRCLKCDTTYIANPEKMVKDAEKIKYLEDNYKLIHTTSCQWYKERSQVTNPGISPLLHDSSVSEDKLLEHIRNGTVFGFCVVDLFPTEDARKFEEMNWGPLFEHQMIEFNQLPEWMQESANEQQYPKDVLCQTFHAEQYFCSVNLAKFYCDNGYRITKLHQFIEFEGKPAIKEFYKQVYQLRVKGTIDNNKCLQLAAKNTANSPYGRCILNPHNFQSNTIVGEKRLKMLRHQAVYVEETKLTPTKTEVKQIKTDITEKYPLALGQNILMESKILLNQFVCFLYEYFDPKDFRIIYSDTDSICCSFIGTDLAKLVRPEKQYEWPEAEARWFVMNPDDPWELRKPGKMKEEWSTTNGAIVW